MVVVTRSWQQTAAERKVNCRRCCVPVKSCLCPPGGGGDFNCRKYSMRGMQAPQLLCICVYQRVRGRLNEKREENNLQVRNSVSQKRRRIQNDRM